MSGEVVRVPAPEAGGGAPRCSGAPTRPPRAGAAGRAAALDETRAWAAAAAVPDPEIPAVTVADLGILRSVTVEDGVAVAQVTPTYTGCPATLAIELAVETALIDAGFEARIARVMSPAVCSKLPAMQLISVDFPRPLAATRPMRSPLVRVRVRSANRVSLSVIPRDCR